MGDYISKIATWIAANPLTFCIIVIGVIIVIGIFGFLIYRFRKKKKEEKKKKYDELTETGCEEDAEEDSRITNKNKGKTKTII